MTVWEGAGNDVGPRLRPGVHNDLVPSTDQATRGGKAQAICRARDKYPPRTLLPRAICLD